LISAVFVLGLAGECLAGKGTAGFSFLKIGVGARPAAMADTFVGLADDINALYWNPAGIARLENIFQGTFMTNKWLEGSYNYFAGVYPMEMFTIGASMVTFSIEGISGTDINDNPTNFGASNQVIAVSIAKTIEYDLLYAGATIKPVISEKIENDSASGYAVDLGGLYKLSGGITLGACIQNLIGSGPKFVNDSYPLPMTIKAGASIKSDDFVDNPYAIAADLSIPSDSSMKISLGGEYSFSPMLIARLGMRLVGGEDLGGGFFSNNLTYGFGGKFTVGNNTGLLVDVAYSPFGSVGSALRMSVTAKF
jgi:hypothetical protein